jgi:hypothetical protein
MSAIKSKIVVRAQPAVAAAPAKMPAASTVKVVAKKSAAAPAPKKAAKKVVVEEVEESEAEEVEERMTPAQIIASMEEQLSALRVALKVKGLTKSGKPRKQREYTGPSEKQAAWNAYVQEVREEFGYEMDEEGNAVLDKKGEPKWAMSYKDAMKEAGERRKGDAELSDSASVASSVKSAPKAATKKAAATVVVAKKAPAVATKKAAVAAAPAPGSASLQPAKKTAAELRAEFLAKKAAAAAAVAAAEAAADAVPEEEAAAEEEGSNEAVEWEFQGQTYFKTSDNLCWLMTDDGERIWAGVYLTEEDRIDDSVEEPSFE